MVQIGIRKQSLTILLEQALSVDKQSLGLNYFLFWMKLTFVLARLLFFCSNKIHFHSIEVSVNQFFEHLHVSLWPTLTRNEIHLIMIFDYIHCNKIGQHNFCVIYINKIFSHLFHLYKSFLSVIFCFHHSYSSIVPKKKGSSLVLKIIFF